MADIPTPTPPPSAPATVDAAKPKLEYIKGGKSGGIGVWGVVGISLCVVVAVVIVLALIGKANDRAV